MRLPAFTYGGGHSYFVTICTAHRRRVLSSIQNGHVFPTRVGAIAIERWHSIPLHHCLVVVDQVVVMPDHVHGLLRIDEGSVATLPLIMAMFKGAVTRRAKVIGSWQAEPLWQRGYYDCVIRGPRHLTRVRDYIIGNPIRWRG